MTEPQARSAPTAADRPADAGVRDQLAKIHGLVVLSMVLTECSDERKIPELVSTTVGSLGQARLCGMHVLRQGWVNMAGPCEDRAVRADLEAQFAVLSQAGGAVAILGQTWGWAFTLRSLDDHLGYLVVAADGEPSSDEQFLLRVLAQQTGIALANARRHTSERSVAAELRTANAALADTVAALERSTVVHERLDQVAVAGGGPLGIARAVHEFTGLPVAVEDRHGNLRAWAGPGRPDPYPKDPTGHRETIIDRARRERGAIRVDGRLMAAAGREDQILGVLVLIDPTNRAGPEDEVALTHGATVLTIELSRQRDVAETELRLGRDLADELVTGTDDESALARAQALGYDLARPHRVVVVEPRDDGDEQAFFHAVRRAARDTGVGSLLVERDGAVVVLADTQVDRVAQPVWERLHATVVEEHGGRRCLIGVGDVCDRPADFPRSYDEARMALRVHAVSDGPDQVIDFAGLGVFRLFAEASQLAGVERFVRSWLGSLLDYDADNRSNLVATLSSYLECGGNYDATAKALEVHRSTIKYRLRRIREIAGRDLADPDTHFNMQLATRARRTLIALRGL